MTFSFKKPKCDQKKGYTHFPPYNAKRCQSWAVDGCKFCDKNFCQEHLINHTCIDDVPFDKVLEESLKYRKNMGHGRRF